MEIIKKKRQQFNKSLTILIVASLIFFVLEAILFGEMAFSILFILAMVDIFVAIILYNVLVKKPFKTEFVRAVLEEYRPGLKYEYKIEGDNYKQIIKELKLIPQASSFQFQDAITDKIGEFIYQSLDLHATHTQSNGKTTTTVTDFKGKIYAVKYGKTFCDYILKEEIFKRIPDGFEFLEVELIEFNKKFNLYVKDKFEAFKVFTPSRIKDFVELEEAHDNVMTIVHYGDYLFIFLYDNSDQFENVASTKEDIIESYNIQYKNLEEYFNIITKFNY